MTVIHGGPVETGLAEGIAAVCVVEACHRSATEHRPVLLSELPLYESATKGAP